MSNFALNDFQRELIENICKKERELLELFEKIPYNPLLSSARSKLHNSCKDAVKAVQQIVT